MTPQRGRESKALGDGTLSTVGVYHPSSGGGVKTTDTLSGWASQYFLEASDWRGKLEKRPCQSCL